MSLDTIRVNICYRPLRIAWAIRSDDINAFRHAVRLSNTLWGGRFNPIVVVDNEEESELLIDAFRVDLILPIGDSGAVKQFAKRFSHLINPFLLGSPFIGDSKGRNMAQILDVHNALTHIRKTHKRKTIKGKAFRVYTWKADDPLADVLLVQLGMYPRNDEIGIDYQDILLQSTEVTECAIDPASPLSENILDYPSISYLSRHGLKRHYSVDFAWNSPGFFVGEVTDLNDLISHWNLRAADIPLWFVDPNHLNRYTNIIPAWEKRMGEIASHHRKLDRHIAVWSRRENIDEARKPFRDSTLIGCPVSIHTWNGRNLRPAMMHFDEVSTLGVIGRERGKPKVSFQLNDKPFCSDRWFHRQHLVASVSFIGGFYGDEQHTFAPPYIPELNEFYARTMHHLYDKLRIESERIGLVIDAADTDTFLYALPVADLIENVFGMAGFSTKLSSAGLIVRQLIGQLGGLQGAQVFKIPGVRRLLKTYGPTAAFTYKSAMQLIASRDPANPDAKFEAYQDLYIDALRIDTKLKPNSVFSHLVEKGLFRIGAQLNCPNCGMSSWIALDALKQIVVCELCGHQYNATRQLVNVDWRYRRSGVLGAEKHAQGAIPVALTLQQLDSNTGGFLDSAVYSPSLNLGALNDTYQADLPSCEVDFVWMISREYPRKTALILGECKDQGPMEITEFKQDIDNLRRVADAFPRKRYKTFVMFTKLSAFTPEEIKLAKTLNDQYRYRAILLTAKELEPFQIYEGTKSEFDIRTYGGSPEELAQVTAQIYFKGD